MTTILVHEYKTFDNTNVILLFLQLLLLLLYNHCTILAVSIKSDIIDIFWLDLLDKIASFADGTTSPLVGKNETTLTWLKVELNQQKHL